MQETRRPPPAGRWWPLVVVLLLMQSGCASRPTTVLPPTAPPGAPPSVTTNRVETLFTGRDALAARLDLIARAEARIDFQYYIFHADNSGQMMAEALLQAADRGVKVRGLVDDMHGADNKLLKSLNAHPNIDIRRYNAFRLRRLRLLEMVLDFGRVGRRMHNKQFTVDGRWSIVGGRNIGDEYFGRSAEIAFADLDVLVEGPAVDELQAIFEEYWRSRHASPRGRKVDPDRVQALRHYLGEWADREKATLQARVESSPYLRARRERRPLQHRCPTVVLSDEPEKLAGQQPISPVAYRLGQQLRQAEVDVLLISAYFVPGEAGLGVLQRMAQRGVNLQVVTNSLASNDVTAVHAGYKRYRKPLLEAGAALWETKPVRAPRATPHLSFGSSRASLHTKAYLFDHRYLFVGSFNLDPRSAVLNTEMGLLFDCPSLAAPLREAFGRALPALAYRVYLNQEGELRWLDTTPAGRAIYHGEPEASVWQRFQVWWLQWLPIESEL